MTQHIAFVKVVFSGLFPPTLLIGIYGNILGLLVLYRQKARNSSIILLESICVANFISVAYASWLVVRLNVKLYLPENTFTVNSLVQIKLHSYFGSVPMTWIAFSTALIAIERACIVTMPMKFHSVWTFRKTIIAVIFIHVPGLLIPIPNLLDRTGPKPFSEALVTILVTRAIPILVVLLGNLITFISFCRQSEKNHKLARQLSDKRTTQHFRKRHKNQVNKLTKTLTVVMVAFFFCVAPGTIFMVVGLCSDTEINSILNIPKSDMELVMASMMYLEVLHCCVNAFLYIFSYRNFKEEFIRLMCCRGKQKSRYDSRSSQKSITSTQSVSTELTEKY